MKPWRPTVTLITATLLTLSACANDHDQRASAATPVRTQADNRTQDTTPAPSPSPTEPRTGPSDADIGVAYPYDLYVHCGPTYAIFGGQTWKVERPVTDPPGEPFARGGVNYLPGTMQLTDVDQLQFTVDANSPVIPDAVVTFRPTTESPPLCH